MWGICRVNLLGTEILSIEIGHQQKQPELVDDDGPPPTGITGGPTSTTTLREVEDVRDTAGWLPTGMHPMGFHP